MTGIFKKGMIAAKKKGLFSEFLTPKSPNAKEKRLLNFYRFKGIKETTIAFDLVSVLSLDNCFCKFSLLDDFPI